MGDLRAALGRIAKLADRFYEDPPAAYPDDHHISVRVRIGDLRCVRSAFGGDNGIGTDNRNGKGAESAGEWPSEASSVGALAGDGETVREALFAASYACATAVSFMTAPSANAAIQEQAIKSVKDAQVKVNAALRSLSALPSPIPVKGDGEATRAERALEEIANAQMIWNGGVAPHKREHLEDFIKELQDIARKAISNKKLDLK